MRLLATREASDRRGVSEDVYTRGTLVCRSFGTELARLAGW